MKQRSLSMYELKGIMGRMLIAIAVAVFGWFVVYTVITLPEVAPPLPVQRHNY